MIIVANQIPEAVVDAYLLEEELTGNISAAIAAALRAWPKAFTAPVEGIGAHNRIVLPLPEKEPRT